MEVWKVTTEDDYHATSANLWGWNNLDHTGFCFTSVLSTIEIKSADLTLKSLEYLISNRLLGVFMFSWLLLSWFISVEEFPLLVIRSLRQVVLSGDMETQAVFPLPLVLAVCNILISAELRVAAVFSLCGTASWVVERVLWLQRRGNVR